MRLKLEAAEKRVEFAEIQAEQDNSKAAENVKQIVLSMHHQFAEKQAAQVENQSPASVVLMQGTSRPRTLILSKLPAQNSLLRLL